MFEKFIQITFYINFGLAFFVALAAFALTVLGKKSAFAYDAGMTAIILMGFGFAVFLAQTVMYAYHNKYAAQAVCAAAVIMYSGFCAAAVYYFRLSTRSDKAKCIIVGILLFCVPPVGTLASLVHAKSARRDTVAQELVLGGTPYTLAALKAYDEKFVLDYVDSSEEEHLEKLEPKAARALLKSLKKQAVNPAAQFKYGEAIAFYTPSNIQDAMALITKAAKADYPPALFNIGYFYENGIQMKKDTKKAYEFYAKAAALGDSDAAMRLGITAIARGDLKSGAKAFLDGAERGDVYAKYNLAICCERGVGVDKDMEKALKLYAECVTRGLYIAERRLFAYCTRESVDINELAAHGTQFHDMLSGVVAVKEKRPANAADCFLKAVKQRGKWEAAARLLVGTLYLDCGKQLTDKQNGAAYISSAMNKEPIAKEIFATIPKNIAGREKQPAKESKTASKAKPQKTTKSVKPEKPSGETLTEQGDK